MKDSKNNFTTSYKRVHYYFGGYAIQGVHGILLVFYIQTSWDFLGVDWSGPVPLEDSDDTVTVEELADFLTSSQKEELLDVLSSLPSNPFSQQGMLSRYAIAKTFVSHAAEN